MATPGTLNLTHYKGDTWEEMTFTINDNAAPLDLTGYSIRMQIRTHDDGPIVGTLSTTGGHFSITNAAAGEFSLVEQIIDLPAGEHVYDMEFTSSTGKVTTYAKGSFTITQDVTYVD